MKRTGTYEWAQRTINCCLGCRNNCRYCYARAEALRFGRIKHASEWKTEVLQPNNAEKNYGRRKGVTMFPSTHDITHGNLVVCILLLTRLLAPGNEVLIVSKPKFDIMQRLLEALDPFKSQVTFRFSIGSMSDVLLSYWEPGAPPFHERFASLCLAHANGWKTSVSAEPLLEPWRVQRLVDLLLPFCSVDMWIGKLNKIRQRVAVVSDVDKRYVEWLEEYQNDHHVCEIIRMLRGTARLRWKDSYKQVAERYKLDLMEV